MKWIFSKSSARTFAGLVLAIAACASLAWAQAAAEYGMSVGKSGVGVAGFGSSLGKSMSRAGSKLSNRLNDQVQNQVRTKSPQEAMKENRTKFEKEAAKGGGTLHVTSDPGDATIYVDNQMVARTPAEVKLPEGMHDVKVSRPESTSWTHEVSITKGQDVSLDAKLKSKYPSTLTLSWDKPK